MKLKFKQQQYQEDAVMSVVNCFEGQKKGSRKDLLARFTRTTDKGTLLEKTEEVEIVSFGNHPIISQLPYAFRFQFILYFLGCFYL